jgi:hypothetical protein
MTTPRGCLKSMTTALKRLAVAVMSKGFGPRSQQRLLGDFQRARPGRRQVQCPRTRGRGSLKTNTPNRLVKPKPIDAKRTQKSTSDPVMLAWPAPTRAGRGDDEIRPILGDPCSARAGKRRRRWQPTIAGRPLEGWRVGTLGGAPTRTDPRSRVVRRFPRASASGALCG